MPVLPLQFGPSGTDEGDSAPSCTRVPVPLPDPRVALVEAELGRALEAIRTGDRRGARRLLLDVLCALEDDGEGA